MQTDRHLIEVKGISKDYESGDTLVNALKDVDFFIEDGEFVAMMGQSGSGKSSLLSIIGGLNHPTQGKLFVDTLDIYGLTSEQRADFRSEYIGIIFQVRGRACAQQQGKACQKPNRYEARSSLPQHYLDLPRLRRECGRLLLFQLYL